MRSLFALVRRLGSPVLVLGLGLSSGACNTFDPGVPLPDILDEINATLVPNVLLLQAGDKFKVSFTEQKSQEKWGQEVRVGPDGKAVFKGLVEIDAVGLTIDELDATLERMTEEDLVNNEVEIEITGLANREVVFIGDSKPRTVSVLPEMKIDFIETMARVGGDGNTFTLLKSVVLIRWMPDEQRRRFWVIDVSQRYWTTPESLYLQAGDIVYIPTHPIKRAGDWIRELTRLIPLPQIVRYT